MTIFEARTLRQRLVSIALWSTGCSLLIACAALFVTQFFSLRQAMIRDLTVKADITGNQCTAALTFKVSQDAAEILGAFHADPQIVYAAVLTTEHRVFAEYIRSGEHAPANSIPAYSGARFSSGALEVLHPIMLQGEPVGSIFIRSDLRNLRMLQLRFIAAGSVALLGSLAAAYLLIIRLQRRVTEPVSRLVLLTNTIAVDRDFSKRADINGPEELAALGRAFNDMLETIRERDRELASQRQDLELSIARLQQSTEELQEANKKLETLDKLKSDFISVVSHELRTPLTAIKAFVELLMVKQNMPAEKKTKLLRTVNDESDRLGRLINDLLDLTRIEAGTMTWRMEPVSLNDVIQVSVDMLLPSARSKDQNLSARIDRNLPRVTGDHDRLVQVVTNLLSNAVKFTPSGGAVTVTVREEGTPADQLVVSVTDTGIGIREEELGLIFDKFHRAGDLLTNKVEGTGLGLAIARQIVEYHGGRIWATSTYGNGSTFLFTIPLTPPRHH